MQNILLGIVMSVAFMTIGFAQESSDLILRNANIVDIASSSPIKKGAIIIRGGIILKIIEDNEEVGSEGELIDMEGQYVIPGLIDAHVHLATVPNSDFHKNQNNMEEVLHKMLVAGITTVRDMAGDGNILTYYKRAAELDQLPAPEIYFAAQFAGPAYFDLLNQQGEDVWGNRVWSRTITDTTDLYLAVAEAKGLGASGIKIYADLSPELVQKITKEAHEQGMKAWSHSYIQPALPSDNVKAEVNTMSHAFDMAHEVNPKMEDKMKPVDPKDLDKVLKGMKEKNILLDPTNYLAENNQMSNGVAITKRAAKIGVQIVAGTDWPYDIDDRIPLLEELKILVNKVHLSPLEALRSATQMGAMAIGLSDRGVIAEGKRADLVILPKNPLDDIEVLAEPKMVIKNGKIYK